MSPVRNNHRDTIPSAEGILERPRLLQKLQAAFDHKLTLITAPPGFGKSTVVAQLTRTATVPVAWQTIDDRSRDLPNLYGQAINALSAVTPGITQLAPPFGYSAAELAALLGDYLAENLTGELLYVVDDVHLLTGAAPAEAWLRTLVTALPPNCHLILASRSLPRLPLVEMIARGEVLAIGLDELRFTPDEIAELGTDLLGQRPPEDQVQQLVERLEGWPAGTALAFHPLPPELEQMALSGHGGPEALFEALARLMLQTQPPSIRNFLLASSTLTRLTPEACAEALGLPNSPAMLMDIQNRNLFVSRIPGALVYHALFRNFLQAELRSADAQWFVELHTQAARWFEANDQPDEAFDHYVNASLPESAAALAEHMAVAYFVQNRVETLLTWNAHLREYNTPAPRLAFRCAMVLIDRYDYDAAEERLRETEATRAPDVEETRAAAVSIQYGLINVLRGNYQAAIDYVADLTNLEPEPTNVRGRALNILGAAAVQLGHTEEAVDRFEAALPFYRCFADNYAQAELLQNLFIAYWRIGRVQDALTSLHEVVALRRTLGGAGPLAMALNSLGYICLRLNDFHHAISALQEGLSAVARFPNRRAESYLLFNLAEVRRNQGEMDEALNLYNQALGTVGDNEPSLACSILCGISTLHRWQNQVMDAIASAEEADRLARKHSIGNEGRLARLALWAARAHGEEPTHVLREIEQLVGEFEMQREHYSLIQAQALYAYIALLCCQTDLAQHSMEQAAALAETLGTSLPISLEILHIPALEALVRQKPNPFNLVIRTLEQVRDSQVRQDHEASPVLEQFPDTVYSLRIVTLGQARIIRDGKAIPTTEWRPAARDLFLYLVFTKQATREQICLSFWPDSPAKRARDNFHTTMHRIREVLGENTIILHEDGLYIINPDISVWCDAYELEALTAQARLLPSADARTEDLWRRAVGLYNGEFLPSLDFEWVTDYRERLHEIYTDALVGLGRCVQARSEFREAIDIYKRALVIEPYREEIHQAIMTCHVAKGAKHKALAQLDQLRKLLRKDLGIGPSNETIQLARTLLT